MTITTLLTLLNREDKKLTFSAQGKVFVLWENKLTSLPNKLDLGKQYIVKLSAKEIPEQLNSNIFLSSIERCTKTYDEEYEGKAKVSGTVIDITSWDANRNDYDLPFIEKKYETSKVTITNGKTNLVLYAFGKKEIEKGGKYNFLISLFKSKPYEDDGKISSDIKYTFESKEGDIVVKRYLEFKIINAKEIDG